MTRFLAVALVALAVPAGALADGPMPFASQDGDGVVAAGGAERYVAIGSYAGSSTTLARISIPTGSVEQSVPLAGAWGVPVVTYSSSAGTGLSADGRTLVLADVVTLYPRATSRFALLDPRTLRLRRIATLKGDFAYDAISPNGARLYLIQHVDAQDATRYVVRAFDVRAMRLLPRRVADRTQRSWVMKGYPLTRVSSADGRWVYTLYANPGGFPFVHALDTVRGVAHCIGLPLRGGDASNLVLQLRDGGRTLGVHWLSGRRWLRVDTHTWRLSPDRAPFPRWTLAAGGGATAACIGVVLLLRRRRARDRIDAELSELLADGRYQVPRRLRDAFFAKG